MKKRKIRDRITRKQRSRMQTLKNGRFSKQNENARFLPLLALLCLNFAGKSQGIEYFCFFFHCLLNNKCIYILRTFPARKDASFRVSVLNTSNESKMDAKKAKLLKCFRFRREHTSFSPFICGTRTLLSCNAN